jgi:pyruvate dehydrogenase E2 component (dihydrolipoamide acetyltransferase)
VPEVFAPQLGFATREITIVQWHKAVGDTVALGEPLVDVEAEKALTTVEAVHAGTLLAIYSPVGAVVAEGTPLGWVGAAEEEPPMLTPQVLGWEPMLAPVPAEYAHLAPPPDASAADTATAPAKSSRALVRHFLRSVVRKITAERMARSWVASPKVDLLAEIDFSRVVAHREAIKAAGGEAPSYNVYIAHGVVRAFEDMPHLNINWIHGGPVPLDGIHVGVAVALEDNLVTISMKHLAGLPLEELQRRFRGLIKKAVGMSLHRDEMYGNSLTVTNLGEFEITAFTAILNPPEVFILAVGKLADRVVVKDGEMVIAPITQFFLSFDHRGVDGAPASRLLQRIKYHLEHYGEEPAPEDD